MQTGGSLDATIARAEREYTDALERARIARARVMAAHGYTPLAVEEDVEPDENSPAQPRPPAVSIMDRPHDAATAMGTSTGGDSYAAGASSGCGRAEASAAALREIDEQEDGLTLLALLEANLDTDRDELIEMLVDLQSEMRQAAAPGPRVPAAGGPAAGCLRSGARASAGSSMGCGTSGGASAGAFLSARASGGEGGEGWQLLEDVLSLLQQGVSVEDLMPQLRRGASSAGAQGLTSGHRALSVRGDDSDEAPDDPAGAVHRTDSWLRRFEFGRRTGGYGRVPDGEGEGADPELGDAAASGATGTSGGIGARAPRGGTYAIAGMAGSDAVAEGRSRRAAELLVGLPRGSLCAGVAGCVALVAVALFLASCVVMLPPLTHGLVYSHLWREYDQTVLSRAGLYWVGPFKQLRLAPATLQVGGRRGRPLAARPPPVASFPLTPSPHPICPTGAISGFRAHLELSGASLALPPPASYPTPLVAPCPQTLSLPHLSALSSDGLRLRVDLSVQWRYHTPALRQLFLTFPPEPPEPPPAAEMPPEPPPAAWRESRSRAVPAHSGWGQRPDDAGGPAVAVLGLLNLLIGGQIRTGPPTSGPAPAADDAGGGGTGGDGTDGTGGDGTDGTGGDGLDGTGGDETDGTGGGPAVLLPGARVLRAVVSSASQTVLTRYAMHELFERKRDITEHVRSAVAAAASPYGIRVEAAQLVQVEIPPAVEEALEASAISKLEIRHGETHKEMMRSVFAIQVGRSARV